MNGEEMEKIMNQFMVYAAAMVIVVLASVIILKTVELILDFIGK